MKKNITFVVLLVILLTTINDFSLFKLLINFATTIALLFVYYASFAIYELSKEHKANKKNSELLDSIQKNKNK